MHVRWIESDASIGGHRGDVVVCIPVEGRQEDALAATLCSILEHTTRDVVILICDGRGSESPVPELVSRLTDSEQDRTVALAPDLDAAFATAAPADLVLLRPGALVAEHWLERLRAAANTDSRVATATALSTAEVSRVAVAPDAAPLGDGMTFAEAAEAVAAASLEVRPRLRAPVGDCTYFRRSALELLDAPSGEGDFAERCVSNGLCHVLAADVLVRSEAPSLDDVDRELEANEPLARALGAADRALNGLSLIIDARNLSGPMNGTRVHVLELIAALARLGRVRLTAIVPPDLSDSARRVLETLPRGALRTVALDTQAAPTVRADVVHRPFQISSPADLTLLGQLADRIVITHQDLIAYDNPSYFRSPEGWEGYRSLTRMALAAADRVVFFSAHARDDALAEDLVEPHRAAVVHIGVDHTVVPQATEPVAHEATRALEVSVPMMLCLGTDYRHKNRVFALRLIGELQRAHGWRGVLVLAGPRADAGSSASDERRLLGADRRLAAAVIELGEVSDAEKNWLLERADLVIYPTVHEGFGLVPFEAADHGVPCAWASGTALSELMPDADAALVPWDVAASAARVLRLMDDEPARSENVRALHRAAARLTWSATAERLLDVYRSACDDGPAPAGARERGDGLMRDGLSPDAMRLVGPGGALPRELERPLLALATHPRLGQPVFGAIKAGYQASRRWRRD